jgi:hypothetical protein
MANTNITKIPAPRTPFLDGETGNISPAWYRFLYNLFTFTGSGTDVGVAVNQGGTGQTSYTDGQLLIGNSVGNTLDKNTLTPGTGIGVTNGNGTIEIDNTGVTSVVAGAGIGVSSATGNVTITNTAVGVTSFSGGATGLTPSTPTTGAVALAGVLNVANGGTGATDAATARTNLGLGSGLSVTITTAKLTALGANGSMTFVNGILTAQTQAT